MAARELLDASGKISAQYLPLTHLIGSTEELLQAIQTVTTQIQSISGQISVMTTKLNELESRVALLHSFAQVVTEAIEIEGYAGYE